MKKPSVAFASLGVVCISAALAHEGHEHKAIEYRQSIMNLVGANFGAMYAMKKGDAPWNDAAIARYGKDIDAVTHLDVLRGFPVGSDKGETKAQPKIWENFDDFKKKLEDLQRETAKLGSLAQGGDRKAIEEQIAATGKTCKACHDDYKKKDD